MKVCCVVMAFFMGLFNSEDSWCAESFQGWFWYKDPIPAKSTQPRTPQPSTATAAPSAAQPEPKTYKDRITQLHKAFDEAVAQAIIEPTPHNILKAQRYQALIVGLSQRFQDRWSHSLIRHDPFAATSTSTPQGRALHQQERTAAQELKLKALRHTAGFFFLYAGSCTYCHAFAPVVRDFATTYGVEVKAISWDGGSLAQFPQAVQDKNFITYVNELLHLQGGFPLLVLATTQPGKPTQLVPVAHGLMTYEDLRANVLKVMEGVNMAGANMGKVN